MPVVNLIHVAEHFFNSLFLIFTTFASGIVIGLLVFGLTMTINVSRAFVFVIIASITAAFIRCVYQVADEEELLARQKPLTMTPPRGNPPPETTCNSMTRQLTNRPTIEMSADDPHFQVIHEPQDGTSSTRHRQHSYSRSSQRVPKSKSPVIQNSLHETSDLISVHSRPHDEDSSAMKKQFGDYLVQIYIDFIQTIIYFVENHKNTIRLKHFDHEVSRTIGMTLKSEDRQKLPHDELNILYAYRIEFCSEPCRIPQFKIFAGIDDTPIFSLCLHQEHLIVREMRRHIPGQNLTLQSCRHGNTPFKTIYSGMIKANVKIRDYRDRVFRITVE